MQRFFYILLLCLVYNFFVEYPVLGQSSCPNLQFESGSFKQWVAKKKKLSPSGETYTVVDPSDFPDRFQIMSGSGTHDPYIDQLKCVPDGYTYSARLGDAYGTGEAESLSYTMTVDDSNTLLIWRYAAVLQFGNSDTPHAHDEWALFKISILDNSQQPINDPCSEHIVYAEDNDNRFQTAMVRNVESHWIPWTSVGIDLSAYKGQEITILIETHDCVASGNPGAHSAYGYFVVDHGAMAIVQKYCSSDIEATLTAPDGFSYAWNTGETTREITVTTPNPADTYTCTLSSPIQSCADIALTTEIEATLVTADFSHVQTANSCNNEYQFTNQSTITKTLNPVYAEYVWAVKNSSNTTVKEYYEENPLIVFPGTDNYTVELCVTDIYSGCSDCLSSAAINITDMRPTITLDKEAWFCPGDSVKIQASGGSSYKWSNGSTDDYIWVKAAGDYWVIGYTGAGCAADTVYFSGIPEIDFSINHKPVNCYEYQLSAHSNKNDNTSDYTLKWELPNGTTTDQASFNYIFPSSGSYILKLTVSKGNCTYTFKKTVIIPRTKFYDDFSYALSDCDSISYVFTNKTRSSLDDIVSGTGHAEWYVYKKSGALFRKYEGESTHIQFPSPGDYIISLQVRDTVTLCDTTVTKEIHIEDKKPIIKLDKEPRFCPDDSVHLYVSGARYYKWSTGETTNNIWISKPGWYSVVGYSIDGCTSDVLEFEAKQLDSEYRIEWRRLDCLTYQIYAVSLVNVEKEEIFYWDFGDGNASTQKTPMHAFPKEGLYDIMLTVTNDICSYQQKQTLTIPSTDMKLSEEPIFCYGETYELRASGAQHYEWSNGYKGSSVYITEPGKYTLTGLWDDVCKKSMSFYAQTYPMIRPIIHSDKNEITYEDLTIHLWTDFVSGCTYEWDFGDGTLAYGNDVYYEYASTNGKDFFDVVLRTYTPYSCVEHTSKRITYHEYIPNTFTPNGDGMNDVFLSNVRIQVYNRNGVLMYEGNEGWDGNYKGSPAHQDTYFYVMYYQCETGEKSKQGYITLIR